MTNSSNSYHALARHSCAPIVISLRGLGHIVSFKNTKMIARGRLITNPKKQKAMESYILAIECELLSAFRTTADATQMEHSLASWTRLSMPQDDSVDWIQEISIRVERVKHGDEGAEITIEKLSLDESKEIL